MPLLRSPEPLGPARGLVFFAALSATTALIRLHWQRQRDGARLVRIRAWPLWRAVAPLAVAVVGAALAQYVLTARLSGGWDAAGRTVAPFALVPFAYALAVLLARFDPRD